MWLVGRTPMEVRRSLVEDVVDLAVVDRLVAVVVG